jgi:hypothetical protein
VRLSNDGLILRITAADYLERDDTTGRVTVWREGPDLVTDDGVKLNPRELILAAAELGEIATR